MATNQGYIVNDAGEVYLADLSAGSVKRVYPEGPDYPASLKEIDLKAKVATLNAGNCLVVPGTAISKAAEAELPGPIMIMVGGANVP